MKGGNKEGKYSTTTTILIKRRKNHWRGDQFILRRGGKDQKRVFSWSRNRTGHKWDRGKREFMIGLKKQEDRILHSKETNVGAEGPAGVIAHTIRPI